MNKNLKNRIIYHQFIVIRRRYSLLEVPWRRIHNAIAVAMSMFFNTPHSALKRHSLPQGARECGRSMIEMLGVLAIIAVLTVGGIAGYSKAMEKFKINKAISEYSMLIYGLLQDIDYIQNLDTKAGNEIWLLDYAEGVGLFPSNWQKLSGKITRDTFGNTLHIFARNNRLVFDIYLQGGSVSLCREFYIDLVKPLHEALYYGRQFNSKTSTFYGDHYCNDKNIKCVNSLTLSDIQDMCKKCENNCALGLEF